MAFFEALQNPARSHNGDFSNGNIVLIKDGFCWPALFFTPLWMLFRGMWLIFAFYIALTLVFFAIGEAGLIAPGIVFWLNIGISLIFAYEANFLRKWTLLRHNYRHIGVSLGANIREAEVNFFAQHSKPAPVEPSSAEAMIPMTVGATSSTTVINPMQVEPQSDLKKSHWGVGGKRKSDSVVGMFSDD